MPKPLPDSYATTFFAKYINLVPQNDLLNAFAQQAKIIAPFLNAISEEKSHYAYAPNKWTIKELLQHITDTERIFSYRSLCFARGEKTNLPGFNENEYAANSHANSQLWKSLVEEFFAVRKSTEILFNNFQPDVLNNSGIAGNNAVTVAGLGFTAIGHLYHHINVLQEKYLL